MSSLLIKIRNVITKHENCRTNDLTDNNKKIQKMMNILIDELNTLIIYKFNNIKIYYSSGSSNNPIVPILYFFDPRETDKGTFGVYPILSFGCVEGDNFGKINLTLTQGEKSVKDANKNNYKKILAKNAKEICNDYCFSLASEGFRLCINEKLGNVSRVIEKSFQIQTFENEGELISNITAVLQAYTEFVSIKELDKQVSEDLDKIKGTNKIQLINARLGQGKFRRSLFKVWNSKCCLTNCSQKELLRASHIKPWRACESDAERLSNMNGLLLTPNIDVVFDQGFITFDELGNMLVSKELDEKTIKAIKLPLNSSIDLTETQQMFMEYHRNNVFKGA